jgi:hypothetical protein
MECSRVQTSLMSRDAELERKNVEIGSLQSDKASLDKLLQVVKWGLVWMGAVAAAAAAAAIGGRQRSCVGASSLLASA